MKYWWRYCARAEGYRILPVFVVRILVTKCQILLELVTNPSVYVNARNSNIALRNQFFTQVQPRHLSHYWNLLFPTGVTTSHPNSNQALCQAPWRAPAPPTRHPRLTSTEPASPLLSHPPSSPATQRTTATHADQRQGLSHRSRGCGARYEPRSR